MAVECSGGVLIRFRHQKKGFPSPLDSPAGGWPLKWKDARQMLHARFIDPPASSKREKGGRQQQQRPGCCDSILLGDKMTASGAASVVPLGDDDELWPGDRVVLSIHPRPSGVSSANAEQQRARELESAQKVLRGAAVPPPRCDRCGDRGHAAGYCQSDHPLDETLLPARKRARTRMPAGIPKSHLFLCRPQGGSGSDSSPSSAVVWAEGYVIQRPQGRR